MNTEEQKTKMVGWRKMGLGIGAITALSLQNTMDFKIAVIIGTIAIVGIIVQGILDYGRKPSKIE